ncbi:GerMN domain-containing protein [Arcanobacterium phocisimile]|uniref:GerMN domain-containing protein n=1 Tax=Arcanobacterium phocisimile TaxID=1302235 RepID=A0ABX7IFF6_9ACTO|nr:LpqB family beta-propeller domain-containing protein [Arcanobacterium phocisimile]QRV01863.1 GerMN domain-containing protein [Arcanobacterium phocisimile]
MKKALTVLLVLSLVVACTRIPTSGMPQAVERPAQTSNGIVLDPQGPADDADPQDIVVGFMRASSAGFSDDFVVARQFLTSKASATWNPTTQVRIYPDSQNQQVSQTRSGAYRVTVQAGGNVDSTGRYTAATADSTLSSEFSLVRNKAGQWRIAVVPDGVTMPESLFQTLFSRTALYFPTQDLSAFIADTRWYPRNQVVSSAARGLVDGPARWLAGSASSLLPSGTRLANPVVIVNGTLARVDLTGDIAELSEQTRNIIYAQFIKTLTSLPGVAEVEISANGVPLPSQNETELPTYPYTSSSVLMLSNGEPAFVKDDGITLINNAQELRALDLSHLAVPYGENPSQFAALGDDRQTLYRITTDGRYSALVTGDGLIGPSIDRQGQTWVSENVANAQVQAVDLGSGNVALVDAPWLEGVKVRSLAVSREGARLAIVIEKDGISQLLVAGIVRNSSGQPMSLSEPIRIGQRLTDIEDIAWIADTRLVAVGKGQNSLTNALYMVPLGENVSVMASLDDIVSVTAGRAEESILLGTSDGDVFTYDAGGWRKVIEGAMQPTLPG